MYYGLAIWMIAAWKFNAPVRGVHCLLKVSEVLRQCSLHSSAKGANRKQRPLYIIYTYRSTAGAYFQELEYAAVVKGLQKSKDTSYNICPIDSSALNSPYTGGGASQAAANCRPLSVL